MPAGAWQSVASIKAPLTHSSIVHGATVLLGMCKGLQDVALPQISDLH